MHKHKTTSCCFVLSKANDFNISLTIWLCESHIDSFYYNIWNHYVLLIKYYNPIWFQLYPALCKKFPPKCDKHSCQQGLVSWSKKNTVLKGVVLTKPPLKPLNIKASTQSEGERKSLSDDKKSHLFVKDKCQLFFLFMKLMWICGICGKLFVFNHNYIY